MMWELLIQDQNRNQAQLLFARKAYQLREVKKDQRYMVIGKAIVKYGTITFRYPEILASSEPWSQDTDTSPQEEYQIGRIYPVYAEIMGIKASRFAKKMRHLREQIPEHCPEYLPPKMLELFQLMDIPTATKQMHFPDTMEMQKNALSRIIFDKLLRIQLHSKLFKHDYQHEQTPQQNDKLQIVKISKTTSDPTTQDHLIHPPSLQNLPQENLSIWKATVSRSPDDFGKGLRGVSPPTHPNRDIIKDITKKLPFELTHAQKRVIKEMIEDLHHPYPMLRLLQGDVGSGKTVVSAILAYYIIKIFNRQVAFLAPLSILAHQHYQTLAKLLLPLGIRCEYLAWSVNKNQKEKIKDDLLQNKIQIIVGTHALIQDDVKFHNLGLAVVDEQHKFGVKQRAFFKKRGSPHLIQMSATPIPRSLALAFFGEFNVSIIDEMPIGRKPIVTKIVTEKQMIKLKQRFLSKIQQGQKLFVVTPLIEESEKMENIANATQAFEEMKRLFGDAGDDSHDKETNHEWDKDTKTQKIINIAMKIHNHLWPTLREKVYQVALEKMLTKEGYKIEKEKYIIYEIEWEKVREWRIDLLVDGEIAIELKSTHRLINTDYKQLRGYLRQNKNIRVGLLMNFHDSSLDVRRVENNSISTSPPKSPTSPSKSPISPSIGLLHGKMKENDKKHIMEQFKTGKINILVATTVIEVGVDIKEATMMIIKNAERFGLSQLHQLRGRIGRNDTQSYCFLEIGKVSSETRERLKAIEKTTDWFKLAELDLQFRGSGEILGTRQSGETDIPYEFLTNTNFLHKVQQGADRLLQHYPNLESLPQLHHQLSNKLWNILV